MGFPEGSVVKTLPANAGDTGSIPGSERFPAGGNGKPLQYSCLENPVTEEPGGLQSVGSQESNTTELTEHTPTTINYFCNLELGNFWLSDRQKRKKASLFHTLSWIQGNK